VILRSAAFAAMLVGSVAIAPQAIAQTAPSSMSREEIEQIVREYLLNNPEVILEAIEGLEEKRRAEAEAAQRRALSSRREAIFNDPTSPVAGNPRGDVTVVEFFDYRCPYCKQVAGALARLLKEDGNVRFVFKELPILGPDSVVAARAALAAKAQGRYVDMHQALMRARGTLDEATVLRIAGDIGLDTARLKADMGRSEIDDVFERNRQLARELSISGTPAFVIGNQIIPGAVDFETLKKLVADARRR